MFWLHGVRELVPLTVPSCLRFTRPRPRRCRGQVPQTLRCLKEHQVTRLVITPTLLKAWLLEAENLSFDPSSSRRRC